MQAIQEQPAGAAPLRALGDALRSQLAEWFSVGLLQLERLSWERSSPELLEKVGGVCLICRHLPAGGCDRLRPAACVACVACLPTCPPPAAARRCCCALQVAAGEAVHPVSGWADLKGRLEGRNRRCVRGGRRAAGHPPWDSARAPTVVAEACHACPWLTFCCAAQRGACAVRTTSDCQKSSLSCFPSPPARVFAFFHQAMPGEPLVVLHTALTSQVARSMAEVLPPAAVAAAAAAAGGSPLRHHSGAAAAPGERTWESQAAAPPAAQHSHYAAGQQGGDAEHEGGPAPSTAVFWSISATQRGLAGVDLGNFLIKQVLAAWGGGWGQAGAVWVAKGRVVAWTLKRRRL